MATSSNRNNDFDEVRILDNFYQTSSFFPMPVVLISTVSESGQTNLGPYSLCFPHIITSDYSMVLIARDSSNTAQNILRTGHCTINFIPHKRKYLKNCVMLGYPGETTEEKMKNSIFSLIPSQRDHSDMNENLYPDVVGEAVQVFECTWNDRFPLTYAESSIEYHFILRVDKILMKPKWKSALMNGKGFPRLPIDFGYRNNTHFWFSRHLNHFSKPIPKEKGLSVDAVTYAVERFDPDIKWTPEACEALIKVPRIFLNKAIGMIVEEAKKEGVSEITYEFTQKVRDKHR
jgi:flavin reductase (DIM6/NTAB) family NADH-FMN oxidoreductase RutF